MQRFRRHRLGVAGPGWCVAAGHSMVFATDGTHVPDPVRPAPAPESRPATPVVSPLQVAKRAGLVLPLLPAGVLAGWPPVGADRSAVALGGAPSPRSSGHFSTTPAPSPPQWPPLRSRSSRPA